MASPLKKIFDYGPLKYSYYDTPEGNDCDKKVVYLTSRAAYIGAGMSIYAGILNKKVIGVPNHLLYVAKWTLPVVAMAGAYGIGTCIAVSARKKDDLLSNAVGAAFAASICGAWRQKFSLGMGSFFGIMAVVLMKRKAMQYNLNGGDILGEPTYSGGVDRLYHYGNNTAHYDMSIMYKDHEKK